MKQLYGYSDPVSKEWTEGVLADIFRRCSTSTSFGNKKDIVFLNLINNLLIQYINF